MDTPHLCPNCGRPLAPNAPQALCPVCLLAAGFPTGTQAVPGDTAPPPRAAFVPPTLPELAPLFPQLEIQECIGRGGMGAVYRARQPALDRLVALKILAPQKDDAPGFAERFAREARALARLTHPNIVAVHDHGQAGPYHYLIMEFVDGVNLRHLLNTGSIHPKEALAIVPQICDALQYAHDQGIVHRDIKPENILLGKNGAVKIADFGLAKLVGTGARDASLTGAGDVMGTPHYMAPEQVEHPQDVDHRADIYSLGVVFYQMLTGELPLGRFGPPSRKVQIDVRLDEIVLRALEKEPELRYQQASGLKTAVETVVTTAPPAQTESAVAASGGKESSHWLAAGSIAVVVFLGFIATQISTAFLKIPADYVGVATVQVARVPDLKITGEDRLNRMVYLILSDPVLTQAASDLNLAQRWQTKFRATEPADRQALGLLRRRLDVRPNRLSLSVSLSAHSDLPAEAAELANGVAAAFCSRSWDETGMTARILDRAVPPKSPRWPLHTYEMVAIFVIGVLLPVAAGGLAFVLLRRKSRARPDAASPASSSSEKEPQLRFQQASGLKTAVETVAAGTPPAEHRPATARARSADWRWFVAVVVRRQGKAVIHWPGVVAGFMAIALFLALFGAVTAVVLGRPSHPWIWLSVPCWAALATGLRIRRGQTMPVAQLFAVDELPTGEAPVEMFSWNARASAQPGRKGWLFAGVLIAGAAVLWMLAVVLTDAHRVSGDATPPFMIRGTVTDAATGKPIAGARVADTIYNAAPKHAPREAWTDARGHFELKTWYEEHTITASAPGYETKLDTLLTKFFGQESEVRMDFRLDSVLPPDVISQRILQTSGTPKDGQDRRKMVTDELLRRRAARFETTATTDTPTRDTTQTDFDRMESNPAILRLQLQQAEKALAEIAAKYKMGSGSYEALHNAKTSVSLIHARLVGDRVQFARVKLAAAEDWLKVTSARVKVGLTTDANRDAAQTDVEIARVRLHEAEVRAAQNPPTAATDGK